jgi:hypothetical protein
VQLIVPVSDCFGFLHNDRRQYAVMSPRSGFADFPYVSFVSIGFKRYDGRGDQFLVILRETVGNVCAYLDGQRDRFIGRYYGVSLLCVDAGKAEKENSCYRQAFVLHYKWKFSAVLSSSVGQ